MKHVALMRELQVVAQLQDAAAPCGLVLGLPMLGQATPVRGLFTAMPRPHRWSRGVVGGTGGFAQRGTPYRWCGNFFGIGRCRNRSPVGGRELRIKRTRLH